MGLHNRAPINAAPDRSGSQRLTRSLSFPCKPMVHWLTGQYVTLGGYRRRRLPVGVCRYGPRRIRKSPAIFSKLSGLFPHASAKYTNNHRVSGLAHPLRPTIGGRPDRTETHKQPGNRVLLVEDEPLTLVKSEGHEIVTALDGEHRAETSCPRCIVLTGFGSRIITILIFREAKFIS
jgi:hypothetical protein